MTSCWNPVSKDTEPNMPKYIASEAALAAAKHPDAGPAGRVATDERPDDAEQVGAGKTQKASAGRKGVRGEEIPDAFDQ